MTRVNVIGAYSESAPISAHEILHGDAFGVEEMIIDDTGYAIDLTGYTMTATAEFADADVKVSRPGNTTELPVVSIEKLELRQDAPRQLTATVTNATEGIAEVAIPSDLSPTNPDPAAERTVLAILYVQRRSGAIIRTTRIVLVYRRGSPS